MASFLSTNHRPTGWHFHIGTESTQLIEIGLRSPIISLQVDCDELCRAASILYSHNIPWIHQERVVTLTDLHLITLILYHWNDKSISTDNHLHPVLTE